MSRKIYVFVVIICATMLMSSKTFCDDGIFYSEGQNIFPVQETKIELVKQDMVIEYTSVEHQYGADGGWKVYVKFEFNNPGIKRKEQVGFVTTLPRLPSGVMDEKVENEKPSIKNFTVKKNGKQIKHTVKRIKNANIIHKKKMFLRSEYEEIIGRDFVYLFDIIFDSGKNIIEHSYIFGGEFGPIHDHWLEYNLKTGSLWAGGKIGELNIKIKPERNTLLYFPESSNNSVFVNKMKCSGTFRNFNNKFYYFRNGQINFQAKDIYPDKGIMAMYLKSLHVVGYFFDENVVSHFNDKMFPVSFKFFKTADKISSELTHSLFKSHSFVIWCAYGEIGFDDIKKELKRFSKPSLRILKNLPFAYHGYKFKSKDLFKFYSQFPWYIPDSSVTGDMKILSKGEYKYVSLIMELMKN